MTDPLTPTERRETVPAALAGERVDRIVALVAEVSRAVAAELVESGRVTVDGTPVRGRSTRLEEGMELAVELPDLAARVALVPDSAVAFAVVHADEAVIVVDKPPGLVVHPGAGNPDGTLVHGLLDRFPDLAELIGVVGEPDRPGVVHRIDRDTSGLLMVARTPDAFESLTEQLQARSVQRRYDALVWGGFETSTGEIDAPIARSDRDPTRMAVHARGRAARTGYRVVDTYTDPVAVTRLECRLYTGRTHQIRVHMQSIGRPVVGDARYGGDRTSLPVPRQFLHAGKLGFAHPTTGEELSFTSPLPPDLTDVLARLT